MRPFPSSFSVLSSGFLNREVMCPSPTAKWISLQKSLKKIVPMGSVVVLCGIFLPGNSSPKLWERVAAPVEIFVGAIECAWSDNYKLHRQREKWIFLELRSSELANANGHLYHINSAWYRPFRLECWISAGKPEKCHSRRCSLYSIVFCIRRYFWNKELSL